MIKINTGKGKLLSFDIDIEGGNSNEIKEGRFIISCPNKNYKLMFNAIIEDNNIVVDLPPLETINEGTYKCHLEVISNDSQYYSIWDDNIKISKNLNIKIKEHKDISDKKPTVILNEGKKINKKINKSNQTVTLYRTIKSDEKTINKIMTENKFSMKPKEGLNVSFYENDSMLVNDLENIEFGLCVGMNVCENGIIEKNKNHTVIVDSTYLDNISEKNVLFIIKNGTIIQLKGNESD